MINMKYRLYIAFIISLAATTFAAIQGPNYNDIRAMGMGNTSTAVTTDRTAVFHNPAGLAYIKEKLQFSLSPLVFEIDGIFFNLVGEMVKQGDKLSDLNKIDDDFINMISENDGNWAGFSYIPEFTIATKRVGFGVYTVLPIGLMIESGHLIPKLALRAERDVVFTTSVGFPLRNDKHAIGASIKYIQRTPLKVDITKYSETFQLFDEVSSSPLGIVGDYSDIKHGMTIDAGFMHDLFNGFRFAWGVKDLVGFIGGEYIAPPRVNLGCSYYFPQLEKVETIKNLIIAFEISNLFGIEKTTEKYEHFGKKIHIGAELDLRYAALRLGLNQGYPTIGVGLRFGLFKADYSFFTEELGYYPGQFPLKKHTLSLGVEIAHPKKDNKKARMSPNDLYNKAKELFTKEQYYDAMELFSRILVKTPDFFKNDLVKLHIAQSQEYLDMRKEARKTYLKAIEDHPKSPVLYMADLGLLRLNYREDDSLQVAMHFKRLDNTTIKDSIRQHADYYYGEQLLKNGNYTGAIDLFEKVLQEHPDYPFAQHSMGVAYASMDSIDMASIYLVNAAQIGAVTPEEKNIVNRSLLMLGFLFYEKSKIKRDELAKAVSALRTIPDSSYYYEDALLGLGWCGIAASQADDCINACQKLRNVTTRKILQAESMLLEAYAYTSLNKNDKAYTLLKQAQNLATDLKNHPQHKLLEEKLKGDYKNARSRYNALADQITIIMSKEQTRDTRKVLDSLHTPQIEQLNEIKKIIRETDDVNKTSFFARNLKQVSADINWAMIKLEGAKQIKKDAKEVNETIKETIELDEEMKKIQEELKELKTNEVIDSTSQNDSTAIEGESKEERNSDTTTSEDDYEW